VRVIASERVTPGAPVRVPKWQKDREEIFAKNGRLPFYRCRTGVQEVPMPRSRLSLPSFLTQARTSRMASLRLPLLAPLLASALAAMAAYAGPSSAAPTAATTSTTTSTTSGAASAAEASAGPSSTR
jgi:hypothetical protein